MGHVEHVVRGRGGRSGSQVNGAVRTAPGIGALDAEALIGQMRDGVLVVDRRGTVLLANRAAQLILSPVGAELVGTRFGYMAVTDDRAEITVSETGTCAEMRVSRVSVGDRPAQLVILRDVTERRRAEALWEQAERTLGVGAYELDVGSLQATYTPGMSRITGRSAEELQSTSRMAGEQVVHPGDLERWRLATRAVEAGERAMDLKFRIVRPGGEVREVHSVATPVFDPDGRPVKVRGVVRDITEERLTERARGESARLLEAIADNTPAVICVKDPYGRFIFSNARHQQVTGRGPEQLAAMTEHDVVPRQVADELAARDSQVLADGVPITSEQTIPGADGVPKTWTVVQFPIPDDQGRPYAAGSVAVDVTEQRRAIEALRESEKRFRLLAERSKDAIYLIRLTPPAAFEYISPAVRTVYGLDPQEVIGDLERFRSRLRPEVREVLDADIRSQTTGPHVFRHVRPDGSANWLEVQNTPIHDQEGNLVALEGTLRDVTDRVNAEQERLDAVHRMEQVERLESLGQLAGGIAHDFNNLLAVILGTAQLVADDLPGDDPRQGDLRRIIATAERGAALTRQLLIFSRREPAQPQILDLNEIITGIEDMLHRTIGEDVHFGCRLQPGLPPVNIDRARIEQVILNLVVNARAAMPHGGDLTIATAAATIPGSGPPQADLPTAPGDYVVLTVGDTGCGMPPEVARRVFEPFFTTRKAGQGTGLGLATVHGIVTDAGGYVTLQTRSGQGTTFEVYLPAAPGTAEGTTTIAATAQPGRGETILLVEDEQPVRDTINRILTRNNYRVLTAAGPEEAISICADPGTTIHALLTDMIMPGMAGTGLADHLHTTTRPGLPVLYMSGYPGHHNHPADRDIPALPSDADVLRKPFAAGTLLHRIRQTLDT